MNLQTLALTKSKQAVGHNIQSWASRRRQVGSNGGLRLYGIERSLSSQLREELVREHVKDLANQQKAKKEARIVDKEFFVSVLGSSATKRETKSYLQRFTPPKGAPHTAKMHEEKSQLCHGDGVNLGGFYAPTAVQESPKFVQHPERIATITRTTQMHVALVKLRAPQTLNDDTINGIGRTLSQLARLGLTSVVVVDCNDAKEQETGKDSDPNWRSLETEQANRVIAAIDSNGVSGARLIDNAIGISEQKSTGFGQTRAHIALRKLLMTPLRRGVIPVIPSVGYTDITQTAVPVTATDVVLALTKEFAGFPTTPLSEEDPNVVSARLQALREEVSLDRLIILDPLGGIPTSARPNGYHVFLNMEQEFEPAKQDLLETLHGGEEKSFLSKSTEETISDLASSNPFSKFVNTERTEGKDWPVGDYWIHLQNLELVRSVLSMLPPSSSALLTTPDEAANPGKDIPFQAARVGTRRHQNPLIHNLLTDKPVYSSSLPVGRLGSIAEPVSLAQTITPTTFAKHGMSVTMLPNPKVSPWRPAIPGEPHLSLTDSQIDLPRLVHLIEDSFGRKLDVKDYLARVNGRMAGVIIAGEYEGGAILTWETPPGVLDDGSPESRARMVPYLDKFAVLNRSQGSGGVADLIFNAMVRSCFPDGVVWRSRKNNPVNKWYFERSRGTWKLPGKGWTMFWTTPDLSIDKQLFLDYRGVCESIQPSWADKKAVLD